MFFIISFRTVGCFVLVVKVRQQMNIKDFVPEVK